MRPALDSDPRGPIRAEESAASSWVPVPGLRAPPGCSCPFASWSPCLPPAHPNPDWEQSQGRELEPGLGATSPRWLHHPPRKCVNARGMGHPERSCRVTDMRRHSALFTNLCRLQGQWALPAASLPQSPGPGPNASADARCCLEVPLCLTPPKGFSPQGACGPPPSCQQCLLGLRSRER